MKIKVKIIYLLNLRFWTLDIYGPRNFIKKMEVKRGLMTSFNKTCSMLNINLFYYRDQ
jgi:hypothetical protein